MSPHDIDLTRYEREQDLQAEDEQAYLIAFIEFLEEIEPAMTKRGFDLDKLDASVLNRIGHNATTNQSLVTDAIGGLVADYVEREKLEWGPV